MESDDRLESIEDMINCMKLNFDPRFCCSTACARQVA